MASRSLPAMLTSVARRIALPVLVGVAALAGGFVLSDHIKDNEARLIYRLVEGEGARLRSELAEQLWIRRVAIQDLAARTERAPAIAAETWQADANRLIIENLQFRAIEWVDPSYAVRWAVPPTDRLPAADLDPSDDALRSGELRRLEERAESSISKTLVVAEGHRQVLVCAPMYPSGRGAGFIVGVARVRDLVDAAVAGGLARGFTIALYEEPFLIYGASKQGAGAEKVWAVDNDIVLGDHVWRVQVWPSAELLASLRTSNGDIVLVASIVLAILLGLSVYLAANASATKADATASAAPTPER